MAFQVVSLITALLVTSVRSQGFPTLGGFMGRNPYHGMGGSGGFGGYGGYGGYGYQNQQQQQQVDPLLLTCIGADVQDSQSQIRVTIRPMASSRMKTPAGFGGLGFGGFEGPNFDRNMDWTVDGFLIPSQLVQKMGSYQVGVFEGGRTYGECKMSALGRILNKPHRINPMMAMGMGPFSPFSMGLNPLSSMYGGSIYGQQQQQPNGIVSNPAVISTGTTMYSGIIHSVSFNDLVGRSMGVCQSIQNKQCYGTIPYCCSIIRDALPASETYIEPHSQTQQVGMVGLGGIGAIGGLNQGNLVGVQPGVGVGVGGGALPLAGTGGTAVAVGDNGLF